MDASVSEFSRFYLEDVNCLFQLSHSEWWFNALLLNWFLSLFKMYAPHKTVCPTSCYVACGTLIIIYLSFCSSIKFAYSLTSRYVAIHSAHTSPRCLRQQLLRTERLWQACFGGLAASDLCRLCQNSGGDTWCLNNCKQSHKMALKVHIMCLWIVTYLLLWAYPAILWLKSHLQKLHSSKMWRYTVYFSLIVFMSHGQTRNMLTYNFIGSQWHRVLWSEWGTCTAW